MTKSRKMQTVSFRSVDEMLDFLPDDQLMITEKLRELVFETIPDVREHLAYNVPFYKRHRNICFIWPGAIAWGNKTNPGVRFGFTQGHLLADPYQYLDREGRKQVFWRDFFKTKDVDEGILSSYLADAGEIDTRLSRKKK